MAIDNQVSYQSLAESLQQHVGNADILTSESVGFEQSLLRWATQAEKRAVRFSLQISESSFDCWTSLLICRFLHNLLQGIVVKVKSIEQVSQAIRFAVEHQLEVAVLGGGHGTNGASSTHDGLVIDLTPMNKVTVDRAAKIAICQGGARWEDVDVPLGQYGLAAVGGRVNNTGIGGLTLGGGYGWLTGLYGLTSDNLIAAKMVLADGSVVMTSHTENKDLFWAIQGAGQCFGVAVELVYRAYDLEHAVWAGQLVYKGDKLKQVIEFANAAIAKGDGNAAMTVGIMSPPVSAVVTTLFYNGSLASAEAFYGPLLQLECIENTTRVMPYCEVNTVTTHRVPWGNRRLMQGTSFLAPVNVDFAVSLVEELAFIYEALPGNTKASMIMLEFVNNEVVRKVAHDATAFANRGPQHNSMILPQWTNPEQDAIVQAWIRRVADKFKVELERMKSEGAEVDSRAVLQYGNYDGTYAQHDLYSRPTQ